MAASTSSRIMIAAPREAVMAVIADFAAYPQWASAVRATEVLGEEPAGRASQVRFTLDAGVVKDTYVLGYDWDGDAGVRWHLAEPGAVISAMDGGYLLADRDNLRAHGRPPDPDARAAEAARREDDHRHGPQGP